MKDQYTAHYRILELSDDADKADIKKAYRRLSWKYHPDQNSSGEATQKFIQIKEAYDVLMQKPTVYRGVVDVSKMPPVQPNTMSFMDALYSEQKNRAHRVRGQADIDVQEVPVNLYKRKKKKAFNPERFLDNLAVVTTNIVSFLIPFVVLGIGLYVLSWLP